MSDIVKTVSDSAVEREDENLTLSTGVVVRLKQAPMTVVMRALNRFPRPDVPLVHIPERGVDLHNPDDPDYIERHNAWKMQYAEAMTYVMVMYGTELVEKPNGMPGPESNKWIAKLRATGDDFPEKPDKHQRYLMWMLTEAVVDSEDFASILEGAGRLSGVSEADVDVAADFHRGDEKS